MREYNIGSSTIYDLKAQKVELLNFPSSSESSSKDTSTRKNIRKPKLEQLDKVLYDWFVLKCSEGFAISGENETEEWIEIDKGAEVTETITDEQIIDRAVNPEKSKAAEDSEEEDLIVEQEKVSWNTAEQYIQGPIKLWSNPQILVHRKSDSCASERTD
jgi:hypothetical protein